MRKIKFIVLFLVFNVSQIVRAQVINTLPRTPAYESYFLYEVKLIEEFIERFNNDPQSYIRQQCLSLNGTDSMITRRKLLKSLLNKKQDWAHDTAQFFEAVTNAVHPQYLSFTDSNWYAEAKCIFLFNGKKVEIPLVLHIITQDIGSKWMIAGVGNNNVFNDKSPSPVSYNDNGIPSKGFIPTSSYGTNFVIFGYIFSEKMHADDYFEPQLLNTPRGIHFISLIKQRKIRFEQVKSISYHFFQVKNWVFTVDQFKRKDLNTGWLISNLQNADPQKKDALLKNLLFP